MSVGATDPTVTAPIPVQSGRPSWRDVFALFRIGNFRLYEASIFTSSLTTWIARVAIDWLVLELTGNLALVGLAVTFQFGPTILLGVHAGVIADRFPRRVIVVLTQSMLALCLTLLALLTILGVVELWQVYLVAFVAGVAGAIETPARVALVSQIVEPARLRTAVSVNGTIFHLGGLTGPVVSGVLIALVGSGWSIGAAVLTTFVSLGTFAAIRSTRLAPVHRPESGSGGAAVALRYLVGKPTLLWPHVLMIFVATFGMTLPVLFTAAAGKNGFDTGSGGYGLYTSLAAVGSVLGAAISARRRTVRLRGLVATVAAFGLALLLAGTVPWLPVFFAGIVVGGGLRLLWATGAETMIQLSTNPGMRGRVLAIYFVVLVGGQAAGGVLIGWVAEVFGMSAAFAVAGGVPFLAAIVVGLLLARRHQLTLKVSIRDLRRGVRIVKRPRRPQAPSRSTPSQRSEHSTGSAP